MEKGNQEFVAFSNNVNAQIRDITGSMKNLKGLFEKIVEENLEKLVGFKKIVGY